MYNIGFYKLERLKHENSDPLSANQQGDEDRYLRRNSGGRLRDHILIEVCDLAADLVDSKYPVLAAEIAFGISSSRIAAFERGLRDENGQEVGANCLSYINQLGLERTNG